jgi:hypothetical protein
MAGPAMTIPCEAEGALRVSFQSGMDSGFRPRGRPRNHKDLCALSGLQARIPDDRDFLIAGRGLLDMGDRGERVVEVLEGGSGDVVMPRPVVASRPATPGSFTKETRPTGANKGKPPGAAPQPKDETGPI